MLTNPLQQLLLKQERLDLKRNRRVANRNMTHINFSRNDYLSLSSHPDVINALIEGTKQYGLGSGSSPLVSGYTEAHYLLEEQFAHFLKRDKAILFNSGYHANLGAITTFADRNTSIIADKLCHASLIDGSLLSRATLFRYQHNDLMDAEALLQKQEKHKLLISESVFSMRGNITSIDKLSRLAKRHSSAFIVDDAHGIGILGESGGGICEHLNLSQDDVPCLITPLGKSIASMGAIVSGHKDMIDALLQTARTYRYSTALPPAICHATSVALTVLQNESWRRKKLHSLIYFFNRVASEYHLTLASWDITPIRSIIIGNSSAALALQQYLESHGIFASCIRPPTVPKHDACIRISLNCHHTEHQILRLLDLVKLCCETSLNNDC